MSARGKLERDLARTAVAERTPRTAGFCSYCGHPCWGVTCRAHRDLLRLDPNYGRTPVQEKEATDG